MGFFSSIAKIAGVVLAPFTGGASLYLTAAAFIAPKVVDKVFDFVMKPFMGLMGIPSGGFNAGAEAERQQGVLIQRQGSTSHIPVVYGYRKVGDIITFAETGSTDNKYLWVAHVFSEGRVAGLNKLFIDDFELPQSIAKRLNQGEIVEVNETKYKGRVKLQFFPGVYYADPRDSNHVTRQTCFFNTDSVRPPTWNSDMVYNGLAVVFARYEWKKIESQEDSENNPFGYNIPSLAVEMFGKILSPIPETAPANEYDTDSARYQVITNSAGVTIGYTNPAEVLLDYLRNPRYGKGLLNSDIDWASWYIAAEKCRTEVVYTSGARGPIMSMNFVLPTEQSIFNNVKALLSNFRGYMPYVQGKYKLKIEDAGNPTDILSGSAEIVAQFTKDNIVGDIVVTGIERTNKYNQMVVTWIDPDNKWSNQEVVYPETEAERQFYINQDSGRENKGQFTASGITNIIMAKDLARILFFKSRSSDTISFTASSQAMELEPGDCINVKGNVLNFVATYPWRVVSTELNDNMTVTIGAVFNPDNIWPYTRWGEPDRFLPVFVPKGAEIVRPRITPSVNNGLLPPYPDKPVSPVTGAPVTPTREDFITVSKIAFYPVDGQNISASSNIYVDVHFTQPNAAMYGGVKMYYKELRDSVTTYTLVEVNLAPGAGREIVARFGPVTFGKTYELKTRVFYVTGENSNRQANYAFTVGTSSITPSAPFAGTPTPTPTPIANLANDTFAAVSAEVQVDGSGKPLNPRRVVFTVTQDISNGPNPYLNGLEVFYKLSALFKWERIRLPVTGTQGDPITFSLNLGAPLFPLVPGEGGTPEGVDNYDFLLRWTYSDGKSSLFQWRATNCSIEYNDVDWGPYNPFLLGNIAIQSKESSTDYVPQLATAEDVLDPRYTEISSPYKITDGGVGQPPSIKFTFYPPTELERLWWRGVRVYYTKAGVAVSNDYVDFIPATFSNNEWSVTLTGITYDDVWEYVLVPISRWGNSNTVEAVRAQYIWGKLHNRPSDTDYVYPSNGNWASTLRVESKQDTAAALARRGTAIPLPPRQDTVLDTFSSTTLLSSGQPFEARRIQFSLKQSVANGVNGSIIGYAIYYKQSDARYWKRSTVELTGYTEAPPPTITFGSHEMIPAMDLGFRSYPNFPGRDQNYDFLVRFVYSNNTESTYESHFLNVKIEDAGVAGTPVYSFSPLGTPGTAPVRQSTAPILERFAPPGDVVDVRDILSSTSMTAVELTALEPPSPAGRIRFGFTVPVGTLKAYLAGFRVLRRQVISGAAPQPAQDDSNVPYSIATTTINGVSTDLVCAISADTVWNREYEWGIIPIVWHQGKKVEANRGIYWRGRVSDLANSLISNPYTPNWFSVRQPIIQTPTELRGALNAPFPGSDPVVILNRINRVNPNFGLPGGDALGYWEITYSLPLNFQGITVYRRQARDWTTLQFGGNGSYYDKANFGGAGQWEIVNIPFASFPPGGSGLGPGPLQTIRLRPAIADYFNDNFTSGYRVYNPRSTTNGGPNALYKGNSINPPGGVGNPHPKYWLLGDGPKGSNATGFITQILIVATTTNPLNPSGNVSRNGVLIDLRNESYVNGVLTRNAPGNIFADAQVVTVADINAQMDISALNLTAYGITPTPTVHPSWTTLLRKPSEGIARPANNAIVQPGTTGWTTNYNPGAEPPTV